MGFLGSAHNVCHAACQGAIAFLAVFGIYIVGEGPLMFLQEYNIYFWSMALAFIFIGTYMYRKGCMSDKIIMFNSGLVIAGIPFLEAQQFGIILWPLGGFFVVLAISLFIKDRRDSRKQKICCEVKK